MYSNVLRPLRMEHTDLVRSERVRGDLVTGYALSSGGLPPVTFREVPLVAAGGVCSTTSDLARYVAALLNGGSGERGRVPMRSGFRPHPDDSEDPYVFRADFTAAGMGTLRVVLSGRPASGRPMRLLVNGLSFDKRPDARNLRLWARGILAGGAAAVAVRRGIKRAGPP
jgi:CubicO group peptidase (beta-lactamase class C family)